MLADLIHHVRHDLSIDQLMHMVTLYSRNLHDVTLPLSIQTMSAKLLVNLIDSLKRTEPPRTAGAAALSMPHAPPPPILHRPPAHPPQHKHPVLNPLPTLAPPFFGLQQSHR